MEAGRMTMRVFQSWWGMTGLPWRGSEWTLAEKLERIVSAGFDGVDVPWTTYVPEGAEVIERAPATGLHWSVVVFPQSVEEFKGHAEHFAGSAVRQLNLQP